MNYSILMHYGSGTHTCNTNLDNFTLQVFLKDHHREKLDMNMRKVKRAVKIMEKFRVYLLTKRKWIAVYRALKERARLADEVSYLSIF